MSDLSLKHTKICAIASCLPSQCVKNDAFSKQTETERKQFQKTTGITQRYIAPPSITTVDLCLHAARKILEDQSKEDIKLVVLVTQTPDHLIPGSATSIQDKLGLPKTTLAFDINLGCSGYVYGLSVVGSMLEQMGGGKALLLVGDVSSKSIYADDKTTAPIFSDAGSATLLAHAKDAPRLSFTFGTDGNGKEAIYTPDGGARNRFSASSLIPKEENGVVRRPMDMVLNGMKIFQFALREVPLQIQHLLQSEKLTTNEVEAMVFHQANRLILQSIARRLKLDATQYYDTLSEYGNTGSASIPVTLCHELAASDKTTFKPFILCGFGVGLSWASAKVDLNDVYCHEVLFLS